MRKWIFLAQLLIVTNLLAYAYGDGNLTIASCGNHPVGGRATIYFSPHIPQTISINQTTNIGVILKLGPTTNRLAGIMLVNSSGNLPTNDGWVIIQDPNRNSNPYNYNEKNNLPDSIEFSWILRAPSTIGWRGLRAKVFYGDGGAKSKEAVPININVIASGINEKDPVILSEQNNIITNIIRNDLNFTVVNKQSNTYIEIFNVLGELIIYHPLTNETAQLSSDLGKLNSGIYFLKLISNNNVTFRKFIKIN